MIKPDPLTPEERAEVSARIKAKAFTIVPLGASSAVLPVWDGQKLVMPAGALHGFRDSMNRFQGGDAAPRRRHRSKAPDLPAHVLQRREKVAALHASGATIADMVKALEGATNSAIRNDLARLGLTPNVWVDPRLVDHAARAQQIRNLARQGLTAPQIADQIGLCLDSTRKLAKVLGVKIRRQRRSDRQEYSMKMAAE